MVSIVTRLKSLCSPALLYFVVSIVALVLVGLGNLGNTNVFTMGGFSRNVPSTALIFVFKLGYILFWTWILNLICRDGHTNVSWFLVLLPYILMIMMYFSLI
jgi:hypothetical protein